MKGKPIDILLVEDNPGDVFLTQEALQENKVANNLYVARDGQEALDFLTRVEPYTDAPTPDIILLDLNLPRMDGRQLLQRIKFDERLKTIPVVVLTTSSAEEDIARSYQLHANCYVTKPVDLAKFAEIIESIKDFWFMIVKLPNHDN